MVLLEPATQLFDGRLAHDHELRQVHARRLALDSSSSVANAFAERWIGTLRRELLDRTINWNQRQLRRLLIEYVDHDNAHRPHRSPQQRTPSRADSLADVHPPPGGTVIRFPRCDGLINEYQNAA